MQPQQQESEAEGPGIARGFGSGQTGVIGGGRFSPVEPLGCWRKRPPSMSSPGS